MTGFMLVSIIIGFMLAVQFKNVREPEIRDTRDTWQLKSDLLYEQKLQAKLMKDITKLEQQLSRYETERQTSKEQVLKETLEELKKEAGLSEIKGPGVILTIEPIAEGLLINGDNDQITPELLKRLLNEVNMYDAKHISVNGLRIINTTVIRDINGTTKLDGVSINTFPIKINIIAEDAEKLRDRLKVSQSIEEFFIENLSLEISQPLPNITVPAYQNELRIQYMEPVIQGKGGEK